MPVAASRNLLLNSLCVVMSGLILNGCGGSAPPDDPGAIRVDAAAENDAERCQKRLSAALQKLQPESMATLIRRDTVVNALNSWLTGCASEEYKAVKLSEASASMLSPAARRFAAAARFTENDTLYIRDCFILRELSAAVWKQADAESENRVASDNVRVVQLFQEIIRSVTVLPDAENRVPIGIFEILLTGRGTVNDRIWIFCEALRQRQLDGFLLRSDVPPANGDSPAAADILGTAEVLVAVGVGSDLLLFDPLRGTAVPRNDDDSLLIQHPAGLDELRGHERWQQPSVQIAAEPGAWSPRMLLLQEQLPASSSVMLYDELAGGTTEIQPLLERIVAAGNGLWEKSAISLWDHPEKTVLAAGSLSEEQKRAYQVLLKPYDAPFERDPLKSEQLLDDPGRSDDQMSEEEKMQRRMMMLEERLTRISQSSDELFGKASQRLLKVRLEQIMGLNDVQMIQQLQQIRIASMQDSVEVALPVGDGKEALIPFPLPEAIRSVHRRATGDALFWTAMCQYVRRDFGASVTTFRNYRRQYPEDKWIDASLFNEAMALVQLGDLDTAATVLREADREQNPERIQVAWLLSRLAPKAASDRFRNLRS